MPHAPTLTESGCPPAVASGPLRVLLWSPNGAGTQYHGAGTTLYRMYRHAQRERLVVSLAHGSSTQDSNGVYEEEYFVHPYGSSRFKQWRFVHASKRWMTHHARQFDVIHVTNAYYPALASAVVACRSGVPTVAKIAAHRGDLGQVSWKRWLRLGAIRRRMVADLNGIIATSQAIYDELLSYGIPETKIARIPNSVDADYFYPVASGHMRSQLRKELQWPDRTTLIFVGGVVRGKRPHLLVHALKLLVDAGCDCQLVLAGPEQEPDYAREIRALVVAQRLESRIIWFGFTRDMQPLYRAADVFVLPSKSEGLPNAMLEAMASGLPVFGTAISGITDLIDDGINGSVIEPNAQDLAEKIFSFLQDDQRLAQAGIESRQRVEANYSVAIVLNAYEQLFQRILRGEPAAA